MRRVLAISLTISSLLAAVALFLLFPQKSFADHETYNWVNELEIQGAGGAYDLGAATFKYNPSLQAPTPRARVYRASYFGCLIDIYTGPEFATGDVTNQSQAPGGSACVFNHSTKATAKPIGNIQNAPLPGSTSGVIASSKLRHIHARSIDSAGKDTTAELHNGSASGSEMQYFLADKEGYYVWQICPDKRNKDDPWFQPASGIKARYRKGITKSKDINDLELGNCDATLIPGPPGQETVPFPKGYWDGVFEKGQSYAITAVGTGGNLPVLPDKFSEYFAVLTIFIDSNAMGYSYQFFNKEGKLVEGGPYDVAENEKCSSGPGGSDEDPCEPKLHYKFFVGSNTAGGFTSAVNTILNNFVSGIVTGIIKLNSVLGELIIISHNNFTAQTGTGLPQAWNLARGFANTLFVLALIVIAFANILRYNIEQYAIKAALPRLIIAILLVNFSLFILGLFVDLANVATVAIQNSCSATPGIVSDACSLSGAANTLTPGESALSGLGSIWMKVIFVIVYLIIFIFLFVLMALRYAVIIAMSALAPIALLLYAIPATQGLALSWWKNFTRFLAMGPVISFLLILPAIFIRSQRNQILSMALSIGFLLVAAASPLLLGGKVFAGVGGMMKKFGRKVGKATTAAAARRMAASAPARALAAGLQRVPFAKTLGTRLGAAGAGAIDKKTSAAMSFAKLKSPKTLASDLKSRDEAISFAALSTLGEKELLDGDGAGGYFSAHARGRYASQAIGVGLKAAKLDARIAPHIRKALDANKMSVPAKLEGDTDAVITSNFTRSLSSQDISNHYAGALKERSIRTNITMDPRVWGGMSEERKTNILQIKAVKDFSDGVRAARLDVTKNEPTFKLDQVVAKVKDLIKNKSTQYGFDSPNFEGFRDIESETAKSAIIEGTR